MIKTYRQIQRQRRLRVHQRQADALIAQANRKLGHALPAPMPLPLLQKPGYSDLCNSPAFLVVFALALFVLVLDLGHDQLGLQWLYALARLTGGAA